jgi:hypothetical protein
MKKILLIFLLIGFTRAYAQTTPGPVEKKITQNLCDCINKLDMTTITTGEQANKAFMDCFMAQMELAPDLAAERGVELSNNDAMRKIGNDIGINLMKQKCEGFMKLAVVMAKKDNGAVSNTTTGTFKRIDVKGFNYIVVADNPGSEKSFLWLRQFPESEKLAVPALQLANKRLKITWQEMEVYLPQAKGYYKVKEITAVEFL